MNEINFELLRARLEFLFRIIGKIFGRQDQIDPIALKRLVQIVNSEGINISFQHRFDDKISFELSERELNAKFAEIVVRHFNNIRNRMNELPKSSLGVLVGNTEILIRDGVDTCMIELKAFFEREEERLKHTLPNFQHTPPPPPIES